MPMKLYTYILQITQKTDQGNHYTGQDVKLKHSLDPVSLQALLVLALLLLPGVGLAPGGDVLEPHDVGDSAAVPANNKKTDSWLG